MTPEQQKDLDRLHRRINERGLASFMNDTKWKSAIMALQSISGYQVKFRTRLVTDSNDPPNHWEGGFPWHVPIFEFIEWLELDSIVRTKRGNLLADHEENFEPAIARALVQARIPFSLESGTVRIWGYVQPGSMPKFIEAAS